MYFPGKSGGRSVTPITWYSAGYGNWLSVAKPSYDFKIKFNSRATTFYKNFEDAADYTAHLLYKEWGHKKLYLPLSGGLDSEFCARILLKNNIPFTPVILKLAGTNDNETWFAEYWCYINKITPNIITLSRDDIKDKIFVPYLSTIHPLSNQIAVMNHLFLADYAEAHNGVSIGGVGDAHFNFESKKFYGNYIDFGLDIHRPGLHPSAFFIYTPEIMLSYHYQIDTTLDIQYNKLQFYNLTPRSKINYLPEFEKVNATCREILAIRRKKIVETVTPHWFGTKEDIINSLCPLE